MVKDELQRAIAAGTVTLVDDDEDLDLEPITLPDGRVLDNAAAEEYGRQVAERVASGRGRPSLTGPGEHSPKLGARVRPALKASIEDIAERDGRRTADVVREALEEYVAAHR